MVEHGPGGPSSPQGFLDGVRVLDVTCALAGPFATAILSDLGAEVIKVEPIGGDALRGRRLSEQGAESLPFAMTHRNKRSLAVNWKDPRGTELIRRLAQRVDVLVENFRPGALAKVGLAYHDLLASCPDLVYCSISGFGQTGPLRNEKGIDLVAQAYGGLMSVTGEESGGPVKAGYPVGDLGAGMWAAIGILGALNQSRAGRGGGFVDVSLADTIAAWSLWEVADFASTGRVPAPLGTAHRLTAPFQAFRCHDGNSLVLGAVAKQWGEFCAAVGLPELANDVRFLDEESRFKNREELAGLLEVRFETAPRDEWIRRLRSAGIPSGPILSIDEVVVDEQFREREMFVRREDDLGHSLLVNTPIMSRGAPRIQRRAPHCGEDTRALLDELMLSKAEVDELITDGVVED